MRIKKFKSATMREGIEAMRRELGSEAVILSSKVVIDGDELELHEIVAGIEPEDLERHRQMMARIDGKTTIMEQRTPPAAIRHAAGEALQLPTIQNEPKRNEEHVDSSGIQAIASTLHSPGSIMAHPSHESIQSIEAELVAVRRTLEELRDNAQYTYSASLPPVYRKYYRQLRDSGMSDEAAGHYIGRACSVATSLNDTEVRKEIAAAIQHHVGIMPAIIKQPTCTTVGIYGALSGAGATSSLVKLAISYRLAFQSGVAIITSNDGMNSDAIKKAQQFGIPCTPCATPDDALATMESARPNYGFIFLDASAIERSAEILGIGMQQKLPTEYVLTVVPASLSEHSATAALRKATQRKTNGIILTKTDECPAIGGLLPAIGNSALPLAYMSNGAHIPDDITVATPTKVTDLLLGVKAPSSVLA